MHLFKFEGETFHNLLTPWFYTMGLLSHYEESQSSQSNDDMNHISCIKTYKFPAQKYYT